MSFTRHRRTSYFALTAAVALSLSACTSTPAPGKAKTSSSSTATSAATTAPTAATVYQLMRKSGAAAKSVHIRGAFTDKGQKLQIDIAGDRAGKNMRALVNDGNGQVEILTAEGNVYVKADAAYWTKNGSAAIAKVAAGKYVKAPASASGLDALKVGTLLDQIVASDMSSADKLNTKVQTTVVDGAPAYLMTTKVGEDAKIYVSADGRARLLRVEGPKSQPGTLVFTQWDAVAPVSAPSADQLATIPGM